jgi:DNA-directed RNA polymerase specialized sigma subunit
MDTPEHQRMVLRDRSLHCHLSQAEVARLLHVSRGRVSQIEREALDKIRAALLDCPEVREWLREKGVA